MAVEAPIKVPGSSVASCSSLFMLQTKDLGGRRDTVQGGHCTPEEIAHDSRKCYRYLEAIEDMIVE